MLNLVTMIQKERKKKAKANKNKTKKTPELCLSPKLSRGNTVNKEVHIGVI